MRLEFVWPGVIIFLVSISPILIPAIIYLSVRAGTVGYLRGKHYFQTHYPSDSISKERRKHEFDQRET